MATITGASTDNALAGQQAFFTEVGQGLTVKDILDDILLQWGIQYAYLAPRYLLKRAIHDMNAAFQMIWGLAKQQDYFSRQTLTLSFGPGVSQVNLPSSVLTLLGPARFASNGQPLSPINTRGQYDSFGPTFLNQYTFTVPNGTPIAYFLESLNSATPDNVQHIFHIVPAPVTTISLLVDVSLAPPRYVWEDYILATPVQFPQLYADSVLIPFCRYKAMSSHFMAQPDDRPTIVADFQLALKLIGAVDPEQKEVTFAEKASDKG